MKGDGKPARANAAAVAPAHTRLSSRDIRFLAVVDSVRAVTQSAIKFATFGVLGYFGLEAVRTLADKTTIANLAVRFLVDTSPGNAVAVSLSVVIVGVGYGLAERKLRQRRTAQMSARIRELENRLDPDRSGSGLTPEGTPNPRDKGG